MIELHGWITIRETYKSFFEEEQIDSVIKKIQEEINKMSWFKPKIEVKNGEYFMQFSSFFNRINPEISEIFEVFKSYKRNYIRKFMVEYKSRKNSNI